MTLPLHHAAERLFLCQLSHFGQLLSNPSIDLELEYIFGKSMKHRFQQCIVHMDSMEILSTFRVRIKYISVTKYAIQTIGWMEANDPKIHPSSWGMCTPSNTWTPEMTPLTIPNDSSIAACTTVQLYNKGPIGYNGMPLIHPKTVPSPSMITTPI